MSILDENVIRATKQIEELHNLTARTNWAKLNHDGFVFELERTTQKLVELYELLTDINKETLLLLEKNTPDIGEFLEILRKDLIILQSNIKMEKTKTFRIELVNATENANVPDLYASLQQKILELGMKARYEIEKINRFLIGRKTPFIKKGDTAKGLLEILGKREEELADRRKRNIELKRKSFFRSEEKTIAEVEEELHSKDKFLDAAVKDARKSLATHLAQINYVEGSFLDLEKKVRLVEEIHTNFANKTLELIKELKKERDYARKMALEIEDETIKVRNEHTNQIMSLEEKKTEIKELVEKRFKREIDRLRREIEDKHIALTNMQKLIENQEKEIKILKSKNELKLEIQKTSVDSLDDEKFN
ncbi:MAG: hypothetical protein WC915_00505 [archaeon]|jgi:hypothetical protein